jgi:hypothetical protein
VKQERWPISWWTALTPLGQDAVLVVLLLGYGLSTLLAKPYGLLKVEPNGLPYEQPLQDDPGTVLLLVLTTAPLLCRRRWPTVVMGVIVAALIPAGHLGVRVVLGSIL